MTTPILNPRVLPSVDAVRAAAVHVREIMPPSRLVRDEALSSHVGTDVYFKYELENPTGSFKVRGAYNVLAEMSPEERACLLYTSDAADE